MPAPRGPRPPIEFNAPAGIEPPDFVLTDLVDNAECPDCLPAKLIIRYTPTGYGSDGRTAREWQADIQHSPNCPGAWLAEHRS